MIMNVSYSQSQNQKFYIYTVLTLLGCNVSKIYFALPGLDNYPANIGDGNFGEPDLLDVDGVTALNAGYYHRYYSLAEDDASGFSRAARGFADQNLFVALNNQTKIAPIKVHACKICEEKIVC